MNFVAKKGQGLVEYALIIVVIVLVAVVGAAVLGPTISNLFSKTASNLGG